MIKIGDLVRRTGWTNIEYSPTEAMFSLGIVVSYQDERVIPGGARIAVVFSEGKRYMYAHHLEVINESR
jgi:hypothetical protein|tara:strand:- start:1643 stop:1849 length:207 start_codon:yes stop_codon:yes gene_type:complete